MASLISALGMNANTLKVNENAIAVVSNNVANMNTEGYSKQRKVTLRINATKTDKESVNKKLQEAGIENADILIVAVGKPNFITSNMISDGVVVIDVGINRTEDGLCGDVDFENVKEKTLVPIVTNIIYSGTEKVMNNILKGKDEK